MLFLRHFAGIAAAAAGAVRKSEPPLPLTRYLSLLPDSSHGLLCPTVSGFTVRCLDLGLLFMHCPEGVLGESLPSIKSICF